MDNETVQIIKINKRKQTLLESIRNKSIIFSIGNSEEYNRMIKFCNDLNINVSKNILDEDDKFPIFIEFEISSMYFDSSENTSSVESFNRLLRNKKISSYRIKELTDANALDTFLLEDEGKTYAKIIYISKIDISSQEIRRSYFKRPSGTSMAEIDKIELVENYKKTLDDD